YFHNQEVIRVENFIGKIDTELVKRFTKAVSEGISLEHVRNWEEWENYDHFLLHRFHPLVVGALIESSTEKKDIKNDSYTQTKIKNACKSLTDKNIAISLPIVALATGMSVSTIRNKGCTNIVAFYRLIQLTR